MFRRLCDGMRDVARPGSEVRESRSPSNLTISALPQVSFANRIARATLRTDVAQRSMEHVPGWISLCLTRVCASEIWSIRSMRRTSVIELTLSFRRLLLIRHHGFVNACACMQSQMR
jgi:hypothetical protein